jgi:hypothetical protein
MLIKILAIAVNMVSVLLNLDLLIAHKGNFINLILGISSLLMLVLLSADILLEGF